jgi:DNA-binding transcriptional ArsR family regulator
LGGGRAGAGGVKKIQKKILRNRKVAYICNQPVAQNNMPRDIFQAVADPTRRSILILLAAQAMTPNAIAEHFDMTRQAVSKHIQVLSECEAVNQHRTGREIYYHFNPTKMKEIDQWLEALRKQWQDRFDQLDKLLKDL